MAGVGGVEVDARLDDLVDAVEDRGVERDAGGGQLAVELLCGPRADIAKVTAGWLTTKAMQLDHRQAGVVSDLRPAARRLRACAGSRAATCQARGEPLAGGEVGELRRPSCPTASRRPAGCKRGSPCRAFAAGGLELDAAGQQRVGRRLGADALEVALARGPLRPRRSGCQSTTWIRSSGPCPAGRGPSARRASPRRTSAGAARWTSSRSTSCLPRSARMGILTYSPLGGGWLSGSGGRQLAHLPGARAPRRALRHSMPENQRKLEAVDQLQQVADEADV